MPLRWLPVLLALVLTAACAGAGDPAAEPARSPAGSPPAATSAPVAGGSEAPGDDRTTVATAAVEPWGAVLVDADGLTLYVFTSDGRGPSTCDATCADNWPPVLSSGPPVAAGRAHRDLFGLVDRPDGGLQVTYDGRPLYRYSGDGVPGDALGAGLGDRWYPVMPDGAMAGGSEAAGDGA